MVRYKYEHYNNRFYKSKEWKKLRLQALKRDLYTCQECKKRGKITPANTVHHIRPIRAGGARLSLDNLETVCAACHNELHKERTKTLKDKKRTIRAENDDNILVFKINKEII